MIAPTSLSRTVLGEVKASSRSVFAASGIGRAWRSTFPCALSGSLSKWTKTPGACIPAGRFAGTPAGLWKLGLFLARHNVGDQIFVARFIFLGHDRIGLHRRMAAEHGDDFVDFHAVTANLELIVGASGKSDLAIREKGTEIPGSIHARFGIGAERIWNEFLCGELGTVAVTAGEACSADINFPERACRYRLKAFVQDIDLGVVDGLADARQIPGRQNLPCRTWPPPWIRLARSYLRGGTAILATDIRGGCPRPLK